MTAYDLLALLAAGAIIVAFMLTWSIPRPEHEPPILPDGANQLEILLNRIQTNLPHLRARVSQATFWHNTLWIGEVVIGTLLTLGIINEHKLVEPVWAALGAAMVAVAGLLRKQFKPEESLQAARYQANEQARLYSELKHGYECWRTGARDPGEAQRIATEGERRLAEITSKDSDPAYEARDRTPIRDLVLKRVDEERDRRAGVQITAIYAPPADVGTNPGPPTPDAPAR